MFYMLSYSPLGEGPESLVADLIDLIEHLSLCQ